MADSGVSVSMSAINKRLEANGGDGVFILVSIPGVKGSPADLLTAVERGVEQANAASVRGGGSDVVWAGPVMPTPKGPMVNLDWVGTDEQNRHWLAVFGESLTEAGYTGAVTAAPQANFPQALDRYLSEARPTAYLAYRLTVSPPPHDPPAWRVQDSVTEAVCRHAVEWGSFPGAVVYLREGFAQTKMDTPDVADALATAVKRSWSARVTYLGSKPITSRVVTLGPDGQVSYQAGGERRDWSWDVDAVRDALLRAPEDLDLGYIRCRNDLGHGLMDLAGDPYRLKYASESDVRYNRHLLADYVPDPNGIQILTRSHLDKATDLTSWDVKALPGDRYLVQARDLRPWFEADAPHADVVDTARSDFGSMILTREIIEADPDGWVPGRQFRIAQAS